MHILILTKMEFDKHSFLIFGSPRAVKNILLDSARGGISLRKSDVLNDF